MSAVHFALRKRFAAPAWAYFEEVRNGTGFARKTTRTADALAMSLYPSRGLELHGVEVKVSRSDWQRELDDPEKAEEIGKYCDRWWLATGQKVVRDISEIPAAWGWLEVDAKGALKTRKEAPIRLAEPLDRLMLAAILRCSSEESDARIDKAVQALLLEAQTKERERHSEEIEKLTTALTDTRRREQRLRDLLGIAGHELGVELVARWGEPGEISEETLAKLRLLGGRDLEKAREEQASAARLLRSASTRARLALRGGR